MKSTAPISNKHRRRARLSRSPLCQKARGLRSKSSLWPTKADQAVKRLTILLAKIDISMQEDLLALFRKTGALLDGHFVLRSGLHSRQYFQCAILLQHTEIAAQVCKQLADQLRKFDADAVISPALGGIIVGQEVGRSLGKRHIFVEKENEGLALRRGFKIDKNERFIVAEDVVTRGGRGQHTNCV